MSKHIYLLTFFIVIDSYFFLSDFFYFGRCGGLLCAVGVGVEGCYVATCSAMDQIQVYCVQGKHLTHILSLTLFLAFS